MNIKKYLGAFIFATFSIVFLGGGFLINLGLLKSPTSRLMERKIDFSQFIDEVKGAYVSDFSYKENFINLNGLFARLTGRHVYNDVSKLKNGMLDYGAINKADVNELFNGIKEFHDMLKTQDIPFLYVQVPLKTDLQDALIRDGVDNYGNQNADALLGLLQRSDVETLDLRQSIAATPAEIEKYFYYTDHHWNTKGAFVAFGQILQYLNELFPEKHLDFTLADPSNWEIDVYEDWFLGSRGKRVGVYFGGVDDLEIYTPQFETEISLFIPKHGIEYHGSFENVIVRNDYLDKPDYFNENPYCAYIGGDYPLVRHENDLASNDLKMLLIKDSFSLPLQSFLSTAVSRLDVLDPRYYHDSTVLEYVERSMPDIVILAINPSVFEVSEYSSLAHERKETK